MGPRDLGTSPPPSAGDACTEATKTIRAAVAVPWSQGLLLGPQDDGVVDLRRILSLNPVGAVLWRQLAAGASRESLRATVRESGGVDDETADATVARFLTDLWEQGLIAEPPAPSAAATSPSPVAADVQAEVQAEGTDALKTPGTDALRTKAIDAAALIDVARGALRQGSRIRFEARGLSMRPHIADGTVLLVEPCLPEALRRGDVVLYAKDEHLIAHRLIRRGRHLLRLRGDSASRLDHIEPADCLGRVGFRVLPGNQLVPLATLRRRLWGLATNHGREGVRAMARALVVRPLRGVTSLRRCTGWALRLLSATLRRGEAVFHRIRRRVDEARAGLMTTDEKDADRRRLYARRAVRNLTATDENIDAGLTLLEEHLLARHGPPPGARVLVLGCGPGRESVELARRGFVVTGVDRDAGMLDSARALAASEDLPVLFVEGEATAFALSSERFDAVVVFSGLYNMVLPRRRRVGMLACAREHLDPRGKVFLTFLSDYVPAGRRDGPERGGFLRAIHDEHQEGDLYLVNEAVHIFPHQDRLAREAREAGFAVETLFRDQRTYDRTTRQVRGYAVLRLPG